ncbi:hypothetical protein D4764_06G0002320 [Takifugu flavidus]|uniref:Uncharacterized protein n=1 Tax=Takifugu flavidus TaxID=433684 RepID=A0A5C6MTY3_9TELE|nr:hypothetical protein D4764_06G0002320 [Takifugu flavidus]
MAAWLAARLILPGGKAMMWEAAGEDEGRAGRGGEEKGGEGRGLRGWRQSHSVYTEVTVAPCTRDSADK